MSASYRNNDVAAKLRSFLWRERPWWEENGVIYFSVTSDGTTGPRWIERLGSKKIWVRDGAKRVLCSEDFRPTFCVMTGIVVLKAILFNGANRSTKGIRAEAERCGLTKPNPETSCLISEKFSREIQAMGINYLVTMHEPIKGHDGSMLLLGTSAIDGSREFNTYYNQPDCGWHYGHGFAFAIPPTPTE